MRIVDRATFLALPAGIVYAKWYPHSFGELHIKGGLRGDTDWYSVSLSEPFVQYSDREEIIDSLIRLDEGAECPVDVDTECGDGYYDLDQRFAIWSAADVDALIARLQRAKADGYGGA